MKWPPRRILPSQCGNGISVSYPAGRERVEHARTIRRPDEHVDVFRIARHLRVMREGERAAEQKRNPGLVQLPQRVDVERGGGVVDRTRGAGFHEGPLRQRPLSHAFRRSGVRRPRCRRAAALTSCDGSRRHLPDGPGGRVIVGRVAGGHFEHTERRSIRKRTGQQRHRHVVDGDAAGRGALQLPAMRVPVHDERDRIAIERLLEPARSEERIDFERLAFDGLLNRRIMQQREQMPRPQARQRRLELQRFIDGFAHELLDDRFSPRTERALAEAAAEPLDAGDADARGSRTRRRRARRRRRQ